MRKYHWVAALLLIVLSALFAFGCAAPAKPSTPSTPALPAPTPPAPVVVAPPAPPPGAEAGPASDFADAGRTQYATSCARCHGVDGQGSPQSPALVGAKASLGKYNTGQGLYDFVSQQMPLGAAGTLSKQAYTRLVVFLMLQNGYITSATQVDSSKLAQITLTSK
jgi:mono/diheme cytochrome c family protein